MSNRSQAELALIGITLIWGVSFTLVKSAIEHIPALLFIAARFTVAALAIALLFRSKLIVPAPQRNFTLRAGALAASCLLTGYLFQTYGLRHTTTSKAAFITGLTTAVVPFLTAIVYRKAPGLFEALGVGVATCGLGLLTLHPQRFTIGYGDAITLGCTLAYGCHILVLGRFSAVASFELLAFTQLAVTAMLAIIAAPIVDPGPFVANPQVITAILFAGILATALAFTVQTWAQKYTSPTRAALIFALEPVFASATSYLVDGELLSARGWLGAALILFGVLLVEWKPPARAQHPIS